MLPKRLRTIAAVFLALSAMLYAAGASANRTVVLTFTGDCTIGSEERTRANEDSFDTLAAVNGYDYFFANFRELFENDDQTVINFEGVLSDKKSQESQSKQYRFRGPTDFAKILTGSSIEACSLANNHTNDYGAQGRENTQATLEANGIHWFQLYQIYIYEKEGIRIAFLSLNKIWNEFDKIKKVMRELKDNGEADAIVVCWHEGMEYRGAHEDNIERTTKTMIDCGADLVVMHHPHVVQGMNIYNNRCVFYSLGNFVFGGNNRIRTEKYRQDQYVTSLYSIVIQARLTFTDEGKYLGQQLTIYPAYNSSGGMDKHNVQINNYQPYRANAEEAVPILEAMQRDTAFELPAILTDSDGLSRIELEYLAAFDNVEIPEGGTDGPQGIPEAPNPKPSKDHEEITDN